MEIKSPRPVGYWTCLTQCGTAARRLLRQWRSAELVGPLFFYDLVRLARRGRSILLRCFYALALLGALCLAYTDRFPTLDAWQQAFAPRRVPLNQLADFSRWFILAVLLAQSAAVLIITPVYLAGAITEEKERQTLGLLFASHLSDREIVLGKLFARLTHLGCVLLTGLPIVLLASLMGGYGDLVVLVSTFLVTGMTLLSAGSVSMLCSVLCRNGLSALMCSYAGVLAFNLVWIFPCLGYLSSPIAFVFVLDYQLHEPSPTSMFAAPMTPAAPTSPQGWTGESVGMTTTYVLLHGLIAGLCMQAAIRNLRTAEPDPVFRTPVAEPRLVPVSTAFEVAEVRHHEAARPRMRCSLLPPPRGDPLLWKEMAHDPPRSIPPAAEGMKIIAVQVLSLSVIFWLLVLVGYCPWYLPECVKALTVVVNTLLRVLTIATATIWCIGVAFRTASSLCRERDRRTLGMLLSLPVERAALLRARWLGGILRWRALGFLLLGIWSLGLLTGMLHPIGVLLLAGSCAASMALLASLGVWLALVCRDTMRAQLSMALLLLVLFVGPWLHLINQSDPGQFSGDPEETAVHVWQVGLNPFAAWWVSGFSWPEWNDALREKNGLFTARLRAVGYGIAVLTTLAALAWIASRRRLDSEPRD